MGRLILFAGLLALALAAPAAFADTRSVPGELVLVPLDVAVVTTGGVAVTALAVGHRTAGGYIQNPVGAAAPLCINELGTASGTTSAGSVVCIAPGATFTITPSPRPLSVVSSDSNHAFAGAGWTE